MAATVHIHRAKAKWKDRFRAYAVVVDGSEAAEVRNGASAVIEVAPGAHEIQAKIDWTSSNPVAVTLGDGDAIHLGVANDTNMWEFARGFSGVADVLVTEKDSYLRLGPIDPPA